MAVTYKATFRPEKRNDKNGILISQNVPLMLDLSYRGRCWYNTGYRLSDKDDFDVSRQKMRSGKKASKGGILISATTVNSDLDKIKGYISEAHSSFVALGKEITAKALIQEMKMRTGNTRPVIEKPITFLEEYSLTVKKWVAGGSIGHQRKKHYDVLYNILCRFFAINNLSAIKAEEVTSDTILSFTDFLVNEYTYVESNPDIYEHLPKNRKPENKRNQNTVATSIKKLKAVINELFEIGRIEINPFHKMAKKDRETLLKEGYDEPVYLKIEELLSIINTKCPSSLVRVRDCFLLQCAIGCRVSDFNNLKWDNIGIENGFFYVHYAPAKTNHNRDMKTIDTPIVKFAADIIQKYKSKLPGLLVPVFVGNVSGKDGYNAQIKKLIKHCKIDRKVIVRKDGDSVPVLISEIASSKLARSTHVDIITKNQLDKYMSGLHERGSDSVDRYTGMSLSDKFILYSGAFKQEKYIL